MAWGTRAVCLKLSTENAVSIRTCYAFALRADCVSSAIVRVTRLHCQRSFGPAPSIDRHSRIAILLLRSSIPGLVSYILDGRDV